MKSRNCADKQVRDHWRPSPTNPCKNAQNFCLLTTTIPPRCTRHVGKDTIIEYGNDTIIPSFSPFLPSFSFLSFLFFLFFFFPPSSICRNESSNLRIAWYYDSACKQSVKKSGTLQEGSYPGLEGARRRQGTRRVGALARHWSINRFRSNRTGSWSDLTRLWNDVTFVSNIVLHHS